MHFKIFPAITKISFPAVEANKAAFVNETIAFGWLAIVLVYLRQTVVEIEMLVIDGMRERKLYEFQLRKHLLHGRTHIRI